MDVLHLYGLPGMYAFRSTSLGVVDVEARAANWTAPSDSTIPSDRTMPHMTNFEHVVS